MHERFNVHERFNEGVSVFHCRVYRAACVAALVLSGCAHPSANSAGTRGGPASAPTVSTADASQVPTQISDSAFWRMVTDFSEPGGYFRSDNFVSNETSFQYVIPELQRTTSPGGVYLGVAPDQNFTYLIALKPRIAFIIDIRRQNLIHHLMLKAMIEMSKDRADFMSLLFARARPAGLGADATPEALFNA